MKDEYDGYDVTLPKNDCLQLVSCPPYHHSLISGPRWSKRIIERSRKKKRECSDHLVNSNEKRIKNVR